jgi:hypothetical protein
MRKILSVPVATAFVAAAGSHASAERQELKTVSALREFVRRRADDLLLSMLFAAALAALTPALDAFREARATAVGGSDALERAAPGRAASSARFNRLRCGRDMGSDCVPPLKLIGLQLH